MPYNENTCILTDALYYLAKVDYLDGINLLISAAYYGGEPKDMISESILGANKKLSEESGKVIRYNVIESNFELIDGANYSSTSSELDSLGYISLITGLNPNHLPDTLYQLAISSPKSMSYLVSLVEKTNYVSFLEWAIDEAEHLEGNC